MSRLARYSLGLVLGPVGLFLLATLAIELLGTDLYQLVGTIVERGIPGKVVGQMLLLRAPYWLVHTVPMALVLGILMGLGRAKTDLEYQALLTAGMRPISLLAPLLVMGAAFAAGTYLLGEHVVPASLRKYNELRSRYAPEIMDEGDLTSDQRLFWARPAAAGGEILYVGRRDRRLDAYSRLLIVTPAAAGGEEIVLARSARLEDGSLIAENGVVYPDVAAADDDMAAVRFDEREVVLEAGFLEGLAGASDALTEHTPDILQDVDEALKYGASRAYLARRLLALHLRFALPVSNFLLVLVVFPLALSGGKARGYSHVFAGLALFGAFFGLLNLSKSLGHQDILSPIVAAWLPDAVFLALGVWLLGRMPR